jgi:hypothetical protein
MAFQPNEWIFFSKIVDNIGESVYNGNCNNVITVLFFTIASCIYWKPQTRNRTLMCGTNRKVVVDLRKIKRAVHMDFHTMPDIPDFAEGFDAVKIADVLSGARVDWITFFARCNIGYSYYETEVGLKHPYYKVDMLGGLLRECHKRDIAVAAYINAGLDHAFADIHRDWLVQNEDGSILQGDSTKNFFRCMCYNTPYRSHLKGEFTEVLEKYPEIDGLFFDCMVQKPCYCPTCIEKMKAKGVDIADRAQVELFSFRDRTELCAEIRAMVPEDKFLFFNGSFLSGVPYPSIMEGQSHHEIECLPTAPYWAYDTFPPYVAYARNIMEQVVFMTGRFQQSWGDFGGYRPKEGMVFDCYYALAQSAVPSIGDHPHPRSFIEPMIYREIGEIYREIEKVEPWTLGAKQVTEIGVLFEKDYTVGSNPELLHALGGATRMLSELKYQFDIVDDAMELSRFRLIILPDVVTLCPETAAKLETFIESGGKVISTGFSGLDAGRKGFASASWDFICKGLDGWDNGFYLPIGDFGKGLNELPTAIYTPGIALGVGKTAKILAEYWQPYFSRHWDGHQGYFYIPYDKPNGDAAVATTGNVTHVCFPIFTSYQDNMAITYKYMLDNCVRLMLGDPLVKCALPSYARASLTRKDSHTVLHLLSYCPEFRSMHPAVEEPITLYGETIRVKAVKAPSKVYSIPDRKPFDFTYADGYVSVKVPEIPGHAMIVLDD